MPCDFRPSKKIPKYSENCQEFNTLFLNIMWINLASFSAVLSIRIFLRQFIFSAVQSSRKSRLRSGEKAKTGSNRKNIGERREPSGILGRGRGRRSLETCLDAAVPWYQILVSCSDWSNVIILTDSRCCWQYRTLKNITLLQGYL